MATYAKISDLDAAAALDGTEKVEAVQSGASVAVTLSELLIADDYPSDTGWTTVSSFSSGFVAGFGDTAYIKRAGWVTITGVVDATAASGDDLFTLPAAYRPSHSYRGVYHNGAAAAGPLDILTSGVIRLSSATNAACRFAATFPVIT